MASDADSAWITPAQAFFSLIDLYGVMLDFLAGPQSYTVDYRTLARLGRTCRGISDASLNVLWSKLSSIDPIFRLLPEDVYEKVVVRAGQQGSQLRLLRPLKEEDFVVFDKYISRVMELDLSSFTNPSPGLSLLSALKAFRDPLFPCMKDFRWHPNVDFGTIQALSIISPLSPKRNLYITMRNPISVPSGELGSHQNLVESVEMFKKPLSTWIPDVLSLDINCGNYLTHPDILGALKTISDLQGFHTWNPIDAAIFDHLAVLPNLRSIQLGDITFDVGRGKTPYSVFPSLKKVHLKGNTKTLHTFFSTLQSQVKDIIVGKIDEQPINKSYIHILVSRHTSTLQHFDFIGDDEQGSTLLEILDVDEFSPLYACTQLRSFCLKASARKVHFTDNTITSMAKSWPMLETLEFYSRFVQQNEWQTPDVTLYGLWPLVEHCPRLLSLSMPVNACVDGPFPLIERFRSSIPGGERSGRHPCTWTEKISFYLSPIENQYFVGEFLNFAFPHVMVFIAGVPEHRYADRIRWRVVRDSLPNVDLQMRRG